MPKKKLLSPILLSASSEVILGLVKDRHTYSHIYEMSFQLTVVDRGTLTNLTNPTDTSFSYNSSVSLLLTHSCAAGGGCNADTTGFLFWPDTLAGTTQTLPCPNTTTMISRTCSLSGVWESVDPSLCTSLTSINTVSFSVGFSIDFQCGVA